MLEIWNQPCPCLKRMPSRRSPSRLRNIVSSNFNRTAVLSLDMRMVGAFPDKTGIIGTGMNLGQERDLIQCFLPSLSSRGSCARNRTPNHKKHASLSRTDLEPFFALEPDPH